jgi:hypothetical protein
MIIEMRTYKTRPGKRTEFVRVFRSKSIPAHAEIGMKILGPFLSVEDPDTFFFMRGFPDLASREPMKAKFYEGELWKRELESVLMPMLENYDVVLVDDPENLVRWQSDCSNRPGRCPSPGPSKPWLRSLALGPLRRPGPTPCWLSVRMRPHHALALQHHHRLVPRHAR